MRIVSQRQARFFGAAIGGAAKNPKGLSDSELRDALRGKKVGRLPKSKGGGKRGKK